MKEAVVAKGPKVTIKDVPIPEPQTDQVVIQVVVSGSNPKDWKIPEYFPDYNANSGDDIAGIVHSVGSNVWEFKPGDRVASFHEMLSGGGSFAEYAVGWSWTTFHIPNNVNFEEAATLPLAAMTAAIGLHQRLGLPDPWTPVKESTPLVVYGGAAAVGAYVIKLARLANIHPIIAVAGRGEKFVEGLIDRSQGDTIVDYRKSDDAVVQGIKDALKGAKLNYAYDATSEHNSYTNIVKVLEPNGHLTLVLPGRKYEGIPETVQQTITSVGEAHKGDKDFAYIYFRYLARGLAEGFFKPHPHEVIAGGLGGVEEGLRNLKEGKASGVKYVFKIGETSGVKEKL
ncbi:zinc-binding oxidoreductase-like protein ToxD [Setomelanomma holmii]|uniref:Zinc-binding oxidoreductase-like protein ToxD n=1 Tax=Setomelanomma holmii TaxID=210430 RepID=A0A9P4H585_9PLEO|nr:zinc-binding oxidoreductase-like protein ToxD [Setomelanomma holmii]